MERGCPYLYTGSKFRFIWPSVLIIQGGLQQSPLGKYVWEKPSGEQGLKITGLNEFMFDSFIRFTQKGHGEITCIFISLQKKSKFLKVDRGIYFKSWVLKLTAITKQNWLRSRLLYSFLAIDW